jgi:beta-lactamase regulating signal transducer with metallopeptidase domain
MNTLIETLNRFGENALHFAWPMLWQSSVLIAVLFAIDFALRRYARAAVRYALWLVLLVKLLLPPSLALPTSAAWWLFPSAVSRKLPTTRFVVRYGPDIASRLSSQPAPVFTPPRPPLSAAAWIVPVWGALSFGLLVWMTARWRQVARDVKRAAPALAWLDELFNAAKNSIGLRRTVRLRVTDQAMSPVVCGLFRPVILLPQSLVEKLPPAQLRAVLLHELTHLRRGDVWANCAQALLQTVYWWHPLVWLANARIRRVREEAVDDAVMLTLRDEAETYAPTLLEVAKLAFNRPLASLGLVGILESRSVLRQRIERLVDFRAPRKAGLTLLSFCGICIFSATALPMGEAPPPSSDASNKKTPTPVVNITNNKLASNADTLTNFEMRTFKVDTNAFFTALQQQTGIQTNIAVAFHQFLSNSGVNLLPPKTIFFNHGLGVLFVRATESDLDAVEKAVVVLNNYSPPQIHIKARFIEVPEDLAKYQLGTNLIPAGVTEVTGILTGPNLQLLLHTLEQSKGTETLAEPEATTTSGRQIQMRATQIIGVITNFTYRETSTNSAITPQTTQVECGPILDAIASVMPDGYTIDLRIIPSLTEFLGYDNSTNTFAKPTSTGVIVNVPPIRPSFYVRQTDAHLKLRDGQTVVLGGLISTQVQTTKDTVPVSGGRSAETTQFRTQTTRTVKKQELLVLITVTLVDAAGNRIHGDDEMSPARAGIPPQDSP